MKLARDVIAGKNLRKPWKSRTWNKMRERSLCICTRYDKLSAGLFLADGAISIAVEHTESLPAGIFLVHNAYEKGGVWNGSSMKCFLSSVAA